MESAWTRMRRQQAEEIVLEKLAALEGVACPNCRRPELSVELRWGCAVTYCTACEFVVEEVDMFAPDEAAVYY